MPGALQRLHGVAIVVSRRPVDELEHVLRHAEIGEDRADHALDWGQRAQSVENRCRDEAEHTGVDTHGHLRGVGGLGEDVEHLADAVRRGVGQVEALAVEALLVREEVHGIDDIVDGDDVDAPAFDSDHRHPRRQHLAHPLDELEKVVRTVDLVDVAGLRIADDEAGTINAERALAVVADHPFGIVLGLEIRVVEVLGLVEHVLAKNAVIKSSGSDGTDVVEAAHGQRLRALHRVPCAIDVGRLLLFGTRLQVVDGGEVKEVLDLALELLQVGVGEAEIPFRQVADDGDDILFGRSPLGPQRVELLQRPLAHQDIDRLAARQQLAHEKLPDEAGRAGDEISHHFLLAF